MKLFDLIAILLDPSIDERAFPIHEKRSFDPKREPPNQPQITNLMGNFLSTQPRKQYTEPEMAAIKQLVEQLIKENLVVVFSKSYCPYCVKACV